MSPETMLIASSIVLVITLEIAFWFGMIASFIYLNNRRQERKRNED